MTVDPEIAWWMDLDGDDITLNTEGDPPYDVERVAALIHDQLGALEGSVLDFGCGTGRLTAAYSALAPKVDLVGVDVAPRILDRARVRLPDATFHLDLPDVTLAGAFSVTVFQHLPHGECERIAAAIGERLAPRASFCFQYVEGTEDAFLSHQVDGLTAAMWCAHAGLVITDIRPDPVYKEWRWITAVRR